MGCLNIFWLNNNANIRKDWYHRAFQIINWNILWNATKCNITSSAIMSKIIMIWLKYDNSTFNFFALFLSLTFLYLVNFWRWWLKDLLFHLLNYQHSWLWSAPIIQRFLTHPGTFLLLALKPRAVTRGVL